MHTVVVLEYGSSLRNPKYRLVGRNGLDSDQWGYRFLLVIDNLDMAVTTLTRKLLIISVL